MTIFGQIASARPSIRNWIDVPELVAFNITSRCNLRCRYCFQGTQSTDIEASLADIVGVLDQLEAMGVSELLIEGGEVFAYPQIHDLLSRLTSYHIRFHIISNGTLIDTRIATLLNAFDLSIGISLDGPTREYSTMRGGKSHDRALATLRTLSAHQVQTYVNCTVTRDNIKAIEGLARLCADLGVYGLVLQQLHCSGMSDGTFYRNSLISLADQQSLFVLIPQLKTRHPSLQFVESEVLDLANVPERYTRVCDPTETYLPKRIFRCGAGRRFCVITADLDIIPCGVLPNFKCGNLRQSTFRDIWQGSSQLTWLREFCETRVDSIPGCGECKYAAVCDGGCRADMFNMTGNWLAPHVTCIKQR
jgi:radical SAM protein with 4Fe4S-binding SPASM domain